MATRKKTLKLNRLTNAAARVKGTGLYKLLRFGLWLVLATLTVTLEFVGNLLLIVVGLFLLLKILTVKVGAWL